MVYQTYNHLLDSVEDVEDPLHFVRHSTALSSRHPDTSWKPRLAHLRELDNGTLWRPAMDFTDNTGPSAALLRKNSCPWTNRGVYGLENPSGKSTPRTRLPSRQNSLSFIRDWLESTTCFGHSFTSAENLSTCDLLIELLQNHSLRRSLISNQR
jgi:hypothetical protein